MKTLSKVCVASVVALASLSAMACGSEEEKDSEERTIVLIKGIDKNGAGGAVEPFYAKMDGGAKAKAAEQKVKYIVDGADAWDYKLQTPIVEKYVAMGVDAILIAPNDKDKMVAPLKAAADKGIVVVTVDTFLGDGDYAKGPVKWPTAFIGSDNKEGGKVACTNLADAIGEGLVYVLAGVDGISSTDDRRDGCLEVLKSEKYAGKIQLIDEVGYDDDKVDKAKADTTAILKAHPDLKGIFGCNLNSGTGAGEAVAAANKTEEVYVVSFDATKSCVALLEQKAVDMCLAQIPARMGEFGIDYALRALDGEDVPRKVLTPFIEVTDANRTDPEVAQYIY